MRAANTHAIRTGELLLYVGISWDWKKRRKLKKSPYTRKGWLHLWAPTKQAKQMLLFDCIAINLQGFWGMPLPIFTPWLIGIAENYNACLGDNCNCLQTVFFKGWEVSACKFSGADLEGNLFWEIGFILLHKRREPCAGVMILNSFLKSSHSIPPSLLSFESFYKYIAFNLTNLCMWNRTFWIQHNLATFNWCYLDGFFLTFTFRQTVLVGFSFG